jgi:hypothetical protein
MTKKEMRSRKTYAGADTPLPNPPPQGGRKLAPAFFIIVGPGVPRALALLCGETSGKKPRAHFLRRENVAGWLFYSLVREEA